MCGRYTLKTNLSELMQIFQAEADNELDLAPRHNIAPTETVPVVRADPTDKRRELVMLRWGLIPFWAKDPKIGNRMINARAETIAEKPSFRQAFQSRRCLIPADGFYEWKKVDRQKIPYLIDRPNHQPFAFAGLWEHWQKDGQDISSCTIITTTPNSLMAELHDRMPVILPNDQYPLWLDPDCRDLSQLEPLLCPCPSDFLKCVPIEQPKNDPQKKLFN